jgi:hypothetical protein
MRIIGLLLFLCLLFSCSTEQQKPVSVSNELTAYIQKRYQTAVSSAASAETKGGKTRTAMIISLGKSAVIDSSQSEPQLFASDIAFRLFYGMKEEDLNKVDQFCIKIRQRDQIREVCYSKKQLQEVDANLLWLDGFFQLIDKKEYALARSYFNPELVDTSTVALESIFENITTNLGKLERHELQGFEIREIMVGSNKHRVLQANYIFFYQEHYTQAKYAVLMDETEQKLVNFKVI